MKLIRIFKKTVFTLSELIRMSRDTFIPIGGSRGTAKSVVMKIFTRR